MLNTLVYMNTRGLIRKMFDIFIETFGKIEDKRQEWKVKHNLVEIIFITFVSYMSNSNTWQEIEVFAKTKESWFRRYIPLDYGIPSHDTLQRVFESIDPKSFNRAFMTWTDYIRDYTKGGIIAIDGKTVRGSKSDDKKPLHLVSAWLDQNSIILGQVKTEEKSNEITAIPELLDLLFIKDCIITIDAMGTQKKIVEKIREKQADYVLALKGNHGIFHSEVELFLSDQLDRNFDGIEVSKKKTKEKGHGRIETREYFQTNDIDWFKEKNDWAGLRSIGFVRSTVETKGKKTLEIRFYISSLKAPEGGACDEFARAVRSHWGIESSHWTLDVTLKEDSCKVRETNGAENLAIIRKMVLNTLAKEIVGEKKLSKNLKRVKAAADDIFRSKLVQSV